MAQRSLQLEVGQHVTLDVTLKVGPNTETVTAISAAELLKTAEASVSGVVIRDRWDIPPQRTNAC